jgi:superfamily II helicase
MSVHKRSRTYLADGISQFESKAFQSFVSTVRMATTGRSNNPRKMFCIPEPIIKHLWLEQGDVIEVALRKVSFAYANQAYNLQCTNIQVTCPKCTRKGNLQRVWSNFGVRHSRHEICYLSKKDAEQLLQNWDARQ